MKLIEEISLPNKLVVEVWDDTRPIADDTSKVALLIKVNIEVKPEYFARREHFEIVQKIFGSEICYEYKMERSFVNNQEKGNVLMELLEAYKTDSLSYLASPRFPSSFVMSKYLDIQKRPYKYRDRLGEDRL